jgi:misacylated tRNA(Ala) deacylase
MHFTSQHVLSAVLEQRLQLPTLSWSLTVYPSLCYVEILCELTLIHDEANPLAFKGRRVHVKVEELHVDKIAGVTGLVNGRPTGKPVLLMTRTDVVALTRRVFITSNCFCYRTQKRRPAPRRPPLSCLSCVPAFEFDHPPDFAVESNHTSFVHSVAAQFPDQISQVVDERKSSEKRVSDLASQSVSIVAKESLPSATR